jgi:proton-dependent oligopeptide transporter, POT family
MGFKDFNLWNEGDWIAVIALSVLSLFLMGGLSVASRKTEEFAGHPRGLYMLFFAEMWERFSYYGMRAILMFYLTKHWLFSDEKASMIYGAYTSLVYITPVLGGWLADRYLGQRKAVLFGGVMLAIGHCLMAFEGVGGQSDPTINIFWLALSFIIVGSGFLKANISVMVGQLYPTTDKRRDGAYSIFYMGINAGAAFGAILVGYLGETLGWGYGFGLAGIGMLLGLVVFVIFKPLLNGRGESPNPTKLATPVFGLKLEWLIYVVSAASVAVIWTLIQYQSAVGGVLLVSGAMLLGYVLLEAFKLDKISRERIYAILFLIAFQPIFWGLFEQAGGALNTFTDRHVDRGGVPASLFQSINSIYIVLLAPLLAWLWLKMGRFEPSAPAKFGLGLIQVGLGFVVLAWGSALAGPEAKVGVIFIFLIYLLHTTGELCLSPVGLSAMNRLSPKHLASLVMGAWFFATAGGNFVAGQIGAAAGNTEGKVTREALMSIYNTIGWWVIGIGIAVALVAPFVKRWMHLDKLTDVDDDMSLANAADASATGILLSENR